MSILNFFKNLFTEKKEEKPKITAQVKMETSVNHNTAIDPIYKKKLSNGLLPGEVILIDWLDGKSPDVNTPRYFEYTYGLNTNESINKLMENGYLRKSNSYDV